MSRAPRIALARSGGTSPQATGHVSLDQSERESKPSSIVVIASGVFGALFSFCVVVEAVVLERRGRNCSCFAP